MKDSIAQSMQIYANLRQFMQMSGDVDINGNIQRLMWPVMLCLD